MKKNQGSMKKASAELAEFIGKKMATHYDAYKIVFAYVKERKLQVSSSDAVCLQFLFFIYAYYLNLL